MNGETIEHRALTRNGTEMLSRFHVVHWAHVYHARTQSIGSVGTSQRTIGDHPKYGVRLSLVVPGLGRIVAGPHPDWEREYDAAFRQAFGL